MKKLLLASVVSAIGVSQYSHAASTTVTGTSDALTLAPGDSLTVNKGATVSPTSASNVAITTSGTGTTLTTVVNNGSILQNGTGRGIRLNVTGGTFTFTNNAGAVLYTYDADAIQANKSSGNVIVNNYGTITSNNHSAGGAQAIDFNGLTSGTNAVYNYAGGVIQATEADAIRPGANGYVFNAGTIMSTTTTGSSSDGIDAQSDLSGIKIDNSGTISGARHGITGGATVVGTPYVMTITNAAGGKILGNNGSGINIDGLDGSEVVTVTNAGLIQGSGVTGDGDGIDVDGLLNLNNTGTILSARAFGSASEGLSVGGGNIVNSGLIEGDNTVANGGGRGITLVGNDSTGPVRDGLYGDAVVTNSGTIKGQTGAGIAVSGQATTHVASITNLAGGVIEGGGAEPAVFTSYQSISLVNYGTILSDNGAAAINLGAGNSSVKILGGVAKVTGDIIGGTGTNTLLIAPGSGNGFTFNNNVSQFSSVTIGAGTTTLNGLGSYAGTTSVTDGGTLLVGDASHTTASIGTGVTAVNAGATLGGYGSVGGSVVNAGTIAVGAASSNATSAAKGTLRIAGNYVGQNGVVRLTASNNGADSLRIGGNASGTTTVVVDTSKLSGTATSGNGMALIAVGGSSTANAFSLAGTAQSGAYQYSLFQGTAAGLSGFYLRSNFGTGTTTAYRPGVVGYSMTPSLNLDYGFTVMGSALDAATQAAGSSAPSANGVAGTKQLRASRDNGVWARVDGSSLDANAMGRFSASETAFYAQFGKDWTLKRDGSSGAFADQTHAGVMFTLGNASTRFADDARSLAALDTHTGTAETHAQSIGGYWIRDVSNGFTLSGIAQFSHYQNTYGDVYGDNASQNGFGLGMGAQVGQRFAIPATSVIVEPQLQLLYQYLHLNHFSDQVSQVSGGGNNALRSRLGLKFYRPGMASAGGWSSATPYFTLGVSHDFLPTATTTVGATAFDNGWSRTAYDVGTGISLQAGLSSTFSAGVKYSHSIGGDMRRDVTGRFSYQYRW